MQGISEEPDRINSVQSSLKSYSLWVILYILDRILDPFVFIMKLNMESVQFIWEYLIRSVSEFNEFEPRLKSAKNLFQLNAGLNLKKLNTILSRTNHNSLNLASDLREIRILDPSCV